MLFWNRRIHDLKVFEFAIGLSVWSLLLGIIFFVINNVFDLFGIRGAVAQAVTQTSKLLGSQAPGQYAQPIMNELQQGKLF